MTRSSELQHGKLAGALPTSIQRELFGSPHVTIAREKIRSDDELYGFLYRVRDDRYYKDSLGLTLTALAGSLGTVRQNINSIFSDRYAKDGRHRVGPGWKLRLSHLIDDIEAGRVGWQGKEERRFEPPNPLPPVQPPLILQEDWNWWSRCRSCFTRRYQVLIVGGRYHCACTRCVDPLTVGGVFDPQRLPLPAS